MAGCLFNRHQIIIFNTVLVSIEHAKAITTARSPKSSYRKKHNMMLVVNAKALVIALSSGLPLPAKSCAIIRLTAKNGMTEASRYTKFMAPSKLSPYMYIISGLVIAKSDAVAIPVVQKTTPATIGVWMLALDDFSAILGKIEMLTIRARVRSFSESMSAIEKTPKASMLKNTVMNIMLNRLLRKASKELG